MVDSELGFRRPSGPIRTRRPHRDEDLARYSRQTFVSAAARQTRRCFAGQRLALAAAIRRNQLADSLAPALLASTTDSEDSESTT
jgi:hypothetical protein